MPFDASAIKISVSIVTGALSRFTSLSPMRSTMVIRTIMGFGLAGLVAVTGSNAASGPTAASWASAAHATCASANARITRLPKMTSIAIGISDLRATAVIGSQENASLAKIPRQPADRSAIGALLALADSALPLLRQEANALERGDTSPLARLQTEARKAGDDYNTDARKLGAAICAENPLPSG